MIGAKEDDRQYRRGVVLGLTMAEIMLLLIFLLLLILAVKLLEERKGATELLARLKEAQKSAALFDELVRKISDGDPKKFDFAKEYQKILEENKGLKDERAESKSAMDLFEEFRREDPEMTTDEAAKELSRLAEIGRKVEKKAMDINPKIDQQAAVEKLLEAAEIGDVILKEGKSPRDLLVQAASCTSNLESCKASNIDLATKLAGKGGTLPSCWLDPMTGKIQYLFTAYLRSDGILLKSINTPDRDSSALPLGNLGVDKVYSREGFVSAGQQILAWSEQQEPRCRFYVRAIDQTGTDKEKYVSLKEKGVEQIFYVFKTSNE